MLQKELQVPRRLALKLQNPVHLEVVVSAAVVALLLLEGRLQLLGVRPPLASQARLAVSSRAHRLPSEPRQAPLQHSVQRHLPQHSEPEERLIQRSDRHLLLDRRARLELPVPLDSRSRKLLSLLPSGASLRTLAALLVSRRRLEVAQRLLLDIAQPLVDRLRQQVREYLHLVRPRQHSVLLNQIQRRQRLGARMLLARRPHSQRPCKALQLQEDLGKQILQQHRHRHLVQLPHLQPVHRKVRPLAVVAVVAEHSEEDLANRSSSLTLGPAKHPRKRLYRRT